VDVRKNKREEGLSKRRNLAEPPLQAWTAPEAPVPGLAPVSQPQQQSNGRQPVLGDIPSMMEGMNNSNDAAIQLQSLRGFRRLLSAENNPPVQACIDCGAVPMFVHFLQRLDNTDLQFEAAWALTNIASTERTRVVVEQGAVPYLVQLLQSPNADIREQCAWCLGNVAGDGHELRDLVLSYNAMPYLLANIAQPANASLLKNCVWALKNFCRGKPQPQLSVLAPALPMLAQIMMTPNQEADALVDATWAFSYISDGEEERIQAVVSQGVVPVFVSMLTSTKPNMIVPALRTLGNIVSGNEAQTQAVVDAGALAAVVLLLSHQRRSIRKEACWMLSNIAAGSIKQLNILMSTPNLLAAVLSQLDTSAEWDVRKEAAWVVSNIATGGTTAHIVQLVEGGSIRPICGLLDVAEVRVLLIAMEALEAILKVGASNAAYSSFAELVDNEEGIHKLEALQEHENAEVYAKAVHLLEAYFGGEEEEDESQNTAPVANASSFSFGLQAPASNKMVGNGFQFGAQPAQFNFGL